MLIKMCYSCFLKDLHIHRKTFPKRKSNTYRMRLVSRRLGVTLQPARSAQSGAAASQKGFRQKGSIGRQTQLRRRKGLAFLNTSWAPFSSSKTGLKNVPLGKQQPPVSKSCCSLMDAKTWTGTAWYSKKKDQQIRRTEPHVIHIS